MKGRFARFLMVGIVAAAINIASRIALSTVLPFEVAVVGAFLIALTAAFLTFRSFVFERSERSFTVQYFRFSLVNAIALIQVWLVSVGLLRWVFPYIGWNFQAELISHIIGVGSPILTSYFAHRAFTFK